ncbi:hypothetical protein DOTSEDRAFT_84385 [Dothistroma septosporum NZE10]|uniref:Zn(2)-C6 fungal-type domain-containing protein n=1 Tax=Dothistroma septosporum (strain NZE10 / CBS 128990) TaxID=675120 RepID=N1PZK0_DOTSN|nr:hypothetical protein DOTSEDRAFT_84385 [Dothistroma septosporum NZE10]
MASVTASRSQQPPRKRRRKTAAGAADDCFSCSKRGTICDRKRPYCGPCIGQGQICSGYPTQLTWNVGVASRGKFRGLSLPVANASEAAVPDAARRRKSPPSVKVKVEAESESAIDPAISDISKAQLLPEQPQQRHYPAPTSTSLPTQYHQQQPASDVSSAPQQWHIPTNEAYSTPRSGSEHRPSLFKHYSLQHIHTAFGRQYDGRGAPSSASPTGSFTDTDFHLPLDYPQTPGSIAFSEPYSQSAPISYTSQPLSSAVDTYADALSSSVNSLQSRSSYESCPISDAAGHDIVQFVPDALTHDEVLFSPAYDMDSNYNPFDQLEGISEDDTDLDHKPLAILDPRFSGPFFSFTPRMQSLMEYYDRHVCPFLVAFDSSENPYRKHVLQLAMHNECLQNAVAALATNNLRMRKQPPPRQIGFVEEIADAFDGSNPPFATNEPTAEETCYKQMSIDQLNMQLTDSRAAQDDSVLATLLILCLFHVCDSGFSKFKTQLAGVQKLLSLRRPSGQSDFTRWVEMFFIWFDVMTSAVNDREMQIKGESLDMLDYSAGLGALEQFSGCDGRLFKLIARLGRLNLLAQGRPVKWHERGVDRMPRTPASHPSSLKRKRQAPRSLAAIDYEQIDGNGWGTPILSSDDDNDSTPDDNTNSTAFTDDRGEFWSEWNDIRARLQMWQMDTAFNSTPPPTSTSGPDLDLGQRDMLHINESFRFSALLYTERLGHPLLPSSHPNFQKYVSKALYHITSLEITSCVNKFLLWPLFICGTECVDEAQRNTIRARCIEVQKESGFYNNLSGLEVLEKVWREVGINVQGMEAAEIKARRRDSEAERTGRYGQAFRWRKAMDRVDGEYILI